jgi:hypothetical protein
MWKPRRPTTLWAVTACYSENFIFFWNAKLKMKYNNCYGISDKFNKTREPAWDNRSGSQSLTGAKHLSKRILSKWIIFPWHDWVSGLCPSSGNEREYNTAEQAGVQISLQTYIVLSSNFGSVIGDPYWGFRCSPQCLQRNTGIVPKLGHDNLFPNIF